MINLLVKFNVKSDQIETFKSDLLEDQKGSFEEAGNVEMKLFQDNKNPEVIFVYERWKDQAAIDFHKDQPYVKKLFAMTETVLASPPEFMQLLETEPLPVHDAEKLNQEDDPVVLFFIFKVKEDMRRVVLDQFKKHIEESRKEEGNLIFDLYTLNGVDDTLAVYEQWRNESALMNIHSNQPYSMETGKVMAEAMIGKMEDYMYFVSEFSIKNR